MTTKIILNERNHKLLIEAIIFEELIQESIFGVESMDELKTILKKAIGRGLIISSALLTSIIGYYNLTPQQTKEIQEIVQVAEVPPKAETWKLVATDVLATVYNAVPEQCNKDIEHTASMFKLKLDDVLSHRIIAMERTFMKELELKYGDVVKFEGTGKYDGVWQIQDTMNKRFAGQHKIDILVPNNIKYGQWTNVNLYVLNNKAKTEEFRQTML